MQQDPPTRSHPTRRLLIATLPLLAMLGLALGASKPVAAGGWAVGSLESLSQPYAGERQEVRFTILQHGVHPVDYDEERHDVGIEIVGSDGEVVFFAAEPDGNPGQYVTTVTFPNAGDYTWSIQMGWFAPQDLGSLTLSERDESSLAGAWNGVRWLIGAAAAVLAATAAGDFAAGRRRTASAPS